MGNPCISLGLRGGGVLTSRRYSIFYDLFFGGIYPYFVIPPTPPSRKNFLGLDYGEPLSVSVLVDTYLASGACAIGSSSFEGDAFWLSMPVEVVA